MIVIATAWDNLAESFRAKRIEWCFTSIMLTLGVVLLWPASTFGNSPTYAVMQWWASEETWGAWFLVGGTVRLIILIINGVWWRTAFLRALAAFLSLFGWASIALGVALAGMSSTDLIYFVVFGFEVSNMRLAARDAGTLERLALAGARLHETGWKGAVRYVIGMRGKRHASGAS